MPRSVSTQLGWKRPGIFIFNYLSKAYKENFEFAISIRNRLVVHLVKRKFDKEPLCSLILKVVKGLTGVKSGYSMLGKPLYTRTVQWWGSGFPKSA